MKKILFVVNHLKGGGIEQVLLDLVDMLSDSYHMTILSIYDTNSVYKDDLIKKVKVRTLDICRYKYSSRLFKSIYSRIYDLFFVQAIFFYFFLKFRRYDSVVAFSDGLSVKLVSKHCKKRSIKKIAWLHTDFFSDSKIDSERLNRIADLYKSFDRVIAVSESLKLKYIEYVKNENVKCIYNPFNPKRFSYFYPVNQLSQKINIIAVGRLSWEKGFDRLLSAVYVTPMAIREKFHLTIIGDGVERTSLENMIEKLEISENVTMVGFVKDPFLRYYYANLLLVPSRYEGFGLVLVEAMRCNIPIIATETSGAKEILSDGKYGMLVPNRDDAFNNILELFCTHPDLFSDYINEYPIALQRFDPSRIIRQLNEVL